MGTVKNEKASEMLALLKSDLFRKFVGGFVLGGIAIVFMQPSDARSSSREGAVAHKPAAVTEYAR